MKEASLTRTIRPEEKRYRRQFYTLTLWPKSFEVLDFDFVNLLVVPHDDLVVGIAAHVLAFVLHLALRDLHLAALADVELQLAVRGRERGPILAGERDALAGLRAGRLGLFLGLDEDADLVNDSSYLPGIITGNPFAAYCLLKSAISSALTFASRLS